MNWFDDFVEIIVGLAVVVVSVLPSAAIWLLAYILGGVHGFLRIVFGVAGVVVLIGFSSWLWGKKIEWDEKTGRL